MTIYQMSDRQLFVAIMALLEKAEDGIDLTASELDTIEDIESEQRFRRYLQKTGVVA